MKIQNCQHQWRQCSENFCTLLPNSTFLRHFYQVISAQRCTDQFSFFFKSLQKPQATSSFIHERCTDQFFFLFLLRVQREPTCNVILFMNLSRKVTRSQQRNCHGVFMTTSKVQHATTDFPPCLQNL